MVLPKLIWCSEPLQTWTPPRIKILKSKDVSNAYFLPSNSDSPSQGATLNSIDKATTTFYPITWYRSATLDKVNLLPVTKL